jgi:hypothetical protein
LLNLYQVGPQSSVQVFDEDNYCTYCGSSGVARGRILITCRLWYKSYVDCRFQYKSYVE